ncbi:hypothetical protein [Argonema antarcticum]|uniref:hypothetical protein n=1 Tax=Argonema antarcticum TaxID=2942763 RepID=UPI0020124D15|nr:hypothetical protein [Argonema antarcticum]MCL1475744.1 hypothetical protein [Argonema antarcticum A004/B2]
MRVLVADASLLFCLEQGHLLEAAFNSKLQLAVPDLLYEYELKNFNGSHLVKMGLCIQNLDDRTLTLAVNYRRSYSKLCLVESFALALAKMSSFAMLSGNPSLHQLAISEQVDCHNLPWLLSWVFKASPIAINSAFKEFSTLR